MRFAMFRVFLVAASAVRGLVLSPVASVSSTTRAGRSRGFSPLRMSCIEEFSISREIKNVRVFDGDFAEEICEAVQAVGAGAIEEKGSFSLAIPGGSVVRALAGLDTEAFDVTKMHVFFCNEKIGENVCYDGALESFAEAKGVPKENVHKVGDGDPEEVAAAYAELIKTHPSVDNSGPLPSLDMVLLGTGDDGHCGMLYPNSAEIKQTGLGKVVFAVDGQAAIAMSMDTFCATKFALVSAAGEARAEMVARALSGNYGDWDCPAGMVDAEETIWFCDEDSIAQFNEMESEEEDEDEDDEDD
mmetsp:Transcript_30462/g.98189  ORF Transcript_30462/g.98189 Transcript_30462/m.98189 type:complete len:301 (-) Transcript_30462:296-1198(-)